MLVPPALVALRGRWHLLRRNARMVGVYGVVAIAGCQLAYFSAVEYLQVGVALLLEYTAPVVVIAWLWLRHGQRPGLMIGVGCVVAGAGLVLVLDVVTGVGLDPVGVLWALLVMLCVATYFVLSAQQGNGLPPIVLAAAGMVVGAVALLLLGVVGLLEMSWSTGGHVRRQPGAVVGGGPRPRRGDRRGRVHDRHRGRAQARVTARLVRRAQRGAVRARLRLAVPRRGAAGRAVRGGALILAGVVLVKIGEPRHP